MRAVFDTNILIDYLNGSKKAKTEIGSIDEPFISLVTWMEVLVGVADADEESSIREFLRRFSVYPVDEGVAERAVAIRRENNLRLPDAIIWATAYRLGTILVTRNTRDFPPRHPSIRIPYRM
ncbi:MAG: type II toxin-antitoxin system VapC family toxin [Gemmatimonadaceae bacterium]